MADTALIRLLTSPVFAFLCAKTPEILELLRLGEKLSPNQEEAIHLFSVGDHVLKTLILTASQLTANCPSVC